MDQPDGDAAGPGQNISGRICAKLAAMKRHLSRLQHRKRGRRAWTRLAHAPLHSAFAVRLQSPPGTPRRNFSTRGHWTQRVCDVMPGFMPKQILKEPCEGI